MKKEKTIMRKVNGVIQPDYPNHFRSINDSIKEGEAFQVEFSNISKGKTGEQLGYLCGPVYKHLYDYLKNTCGWDTVFLPNIGEVKLTKKSLDLYFKDLYSMYIQKEFSKADADKDEMHGYISFLDEWSIQEIGKPIPDAIRKDKDNQ